MNSADNSCNPNELRLLHKPAIDRSKRAYSKKFRVYIFREFLLEKYSSELFNLTDKNECDNETIVLDVAGGKGDLSWLLTHVDNIRSIVLDPRLSGTNDHIRKSVDFLVANPEECQLRATRNLHTYQPLAALMPQIMHKLADLHKPEQMKLYVNQALVDAVKGIIEQLGSKNMCMKQMDKIENCSWSEFWKQSSLHTDVDINDKHVITSCQIALKSILGAKLLVGFHPDQATDACIDLARVLGVPFAIVPCCVFPSEFPNRKIWYLESENENDEASLFCYPVEDVNKKRSLNEEFVDPKQSYVNQQSAFNSRPVKRYNDLLVYLKQKNPEIKSSILPFEGTTTSKNVVNYTLL